MGQGGHPDDASDRSQKAKEDARDFLFFSRSTAGHFDLGQGLAPENRTRTIMDLAEHFPGGGTDFEQPLQAALEFTDESAFKRGDIVLITDGECQVKDEWAKWFKQTKKSRGVFLFAILIDVDTNSEDQLKTLSDKVARVSGLTSDETKSLFSS